MRPHAPVHIELMASKVYSYLSVGMRPCTEGGQLGQCSAISSCGVPELEAAETLQTVVGVEDPVTAQERSINAILTASRRGNITKPPEQKAGGSTIEVIRQQCFKLHERLKYHPAMHLQANQRSSMTSDTQHDLGASCRNHSSQPERLPFDWHLFAGRNQLDAMQGCIAHTRRQECQASQGSCR